MDDLVRDGLRDVARGPRAEAVEQLLVYAAGHYAGLVSAFPPGDAASAAAVMVKGSIESIGHLLGLAAGEGRLPTRLAAAVAGKTTNLSRWAAAVEAIAPAHAGTRDGVVEVVFANSPEGITAITAGLADTLAEMVAAALPGKPVGDRPAKAPPAPPRRGRARKSVDVDGLLVRLVKQVSKRCRAEDRDAYLEQEVYCKGSAELAEMLLGEFTEEVSSATIRRKKDGQHVSTLYARWKRYREAACGASRDRDERDQVDEMIRGGSIVERSRRR